MDDIERSPIPLPSIQVHWYDEHVAFVARSEQHPGVVVADPWSSLAAVDGLIETICPDFLGCGLPLS